MMVQEVAAYQQCDVVVAISNADRAEIATMESPKIFHYREFHPEHCHFFIILGYYPPSPFFLARDRARACARR